MGAPEHGQAQISTADRIRGIVSTGAERQGAQARTRGAQYASTELGAAMLRQAQPSFDRL